jgi:hypothetical protein
MIHERYDLDKWVREFPLSRLKSYSFGATITGPGEMALVEQIRDEVRASGADLGPPVPVDVCIWNLGDSPRRDVTKIGGAPFWPAAEPWPEGDRPYTFVAQFCFADSYDIVPDLPGDILVLLAEEDNYLSWSFRWFDLGERDLLEPTDLPEAGWKIHPCHAALHRTAEYPEADYELFESYPFPLNLWAHLVRDASKIGGYWYLRGDLADPEDEDVPSWMKKELVKAWKKVRRQEKEFLCQLSSIYLSPMRPFLNVSSRAVKKQLRGEDKPLCIHDVGGVDLFFNGKKVYEDIWSG